METWILILYFASGPTLGGEYYSWDRCIEAGYRQGQHFQVKWRCSMTRGPT
jgi:hypothetical protein